MEKNLSCTEDEKNKCNLLNPKKDAVFYKIFRRENIHLLESLISSILKEKVKIKNINTTRDEDKIKMDDNLEITDIKIELEDKTKCLLEIQLNGEFDSARTLYYMSKEFLKQENKIEMNNMNRVVSIVILNNEIIQKNKGQENDDRLYTKCFLKDCLSGKNILTEKIEIDLIEIPKITRLYEKFKDDPLCQWMMFFDNPNGSEIAEIIDKNEFIEQAVEELKKISRDDNIKKK